METQLPPSHTIMQDWLWVSDDVPVYENGILALTSLVYCMLNEMLKCMYLRKLSQTVGVMYTYMHLIL